MSRRRPQRIGLLAAMAVAIAVVALASGRWAAPAAADADPPSDVLLLQDVYFPYHPAISAPLRAKLNDLVARARRAGLPLKVAIVATPGDLGAVPKLFGHPARYATFLEQEIRTNVPQPLLTVMPNGYGTAATSAAGAALVARLPRPAAVTGPALAAATLDAIERLARADGHPLDTSDLGQGTHRASSSGGGGTSPLLIFAPLALVAVLVAAAALRGRRRGRRGAGPAAPSPFDWDRD